MGLDWIVGWDGMGLDGTGESLPRREALPFPVSPLSRFLDAKYLSPQISCIQGTVCFNILSLFRVY